jgi:hypothetical protein
MCAGDTAAADDTNAKFFVHCLNLRKILENSISIVPVCARFVKAKMQKSHKWQAIFPPLPYGKN